MARLNKNTAYSAEDIEVLEGLEAVRKRPGMYIAGTDTIEGLHQLVLEILDNSVDEAMNGFADTITVRLKNRRTTVSVEDNGRGIPVDMHPKFKKPALELILTTLHAGGKFSGKSYSASGGLHGVGSSVVNALSETMTATVIRGGHEYTQVFKKGVAASKLKKNKTKIVGSGTKIEFTPDFPLFKLKEFSSSYIQDRIKIKSFLNPGLTIIFVDEEDDKQIEFCYPDGIRAYLSEVLAERKAKVIGEPFSFTQEGQLPIDVAFVWTESPTEHFLSFVNGIFTVDGGTHEQGARNGIVRAVRNYMQVHDSIPKNVKIGAEDIREGLVCILSVKMSADIHQPQFQGQTKSKLNNPEITSLVDAALKVFEQELNQKPSLAQTIVDRIIVAAKARAASRSASQQVRRKVGLGQRMTLPGKLADCSSNSSKDTELFIVEGDSAGGSTKQGRDRKCQAVLPLRGKVLNVITSTSAKVLENKELSNIIAALGIGVGKDCSVKKLRYGKVIILTDADADGMHIGTLLLAFFFTHMRPLIEAGHLYLGQSPLFGVYLSKKGKTKDEDLRHWAYSDQQLEKITKKYSGRVQRIVRYKGLGEMNPDTLWETTLDPARRTLLQVSIDDIALVEEAFLGLMGADSSTRYQLIQDNALRLQVDV